MTEPRIPVRGSGGNGRVYGQPSPDLFDPPRQPRWKMDLAQLATVLAAIVASIVVSWFSQQHQVKANTADLARLERNVTELEQRKETTSVELAEVRKDLSAIIQRLDDISRRLDRIDGG